MCLQVQYSAALDSSAAYAYPAAVASAASCGAGTIFTSLQMLEETIGPAKSTFAWLLVAGDSEDFDGAAHAGVGVPPLEVPQLAPPKKALPDWLRQEMLKRGIGLNAQAGE